MKVFNKFIIVQLDEEKRTLGNGLQVKETRGKRDIVEGKVLAVCDNALVQPDDTIMFPLYACNPMELNGHPVVCLSSDDIILKI